MRGLCKEEDYAFLCVSEKTAEEGREDDKGVGATEDDWRVKKEERVKIKTLFICIFIYFIFLAALIKLCLHFRSTVDVSGSSRKWKDSANLRRPRR